MPGTLTRERRVGGGPWSVCLDGMTLHRREFLKMGSAAAFAIARPRLYRYSRASPDLQALATRAIEAARAAGARFADVRLSVTRTRRFLPTAGDSDVITESEELGAGVRALTDGDWGFASTPRWTGDDLARIGREAVLQAKATASTTSRPIELGLPSPAGSGTWRTPIRIDPFDVAFDEVYDWMEGFASYALACGAASVDWHVELRSQMRAYASTDGAFFTQTVYATAPAFTVGVSRPSGEILQARSATLVAANRGWEHVLEAPIKDEIPRLLESIRQDIALPVKPVDVARYDVVFDPSGIAPLLTETIGYATQLDRALSYEANADGTSVVTDPLRMRGSYQIGSPLLTVTANRSLPGGLATVKWDDEGVEPDEFALVTDGRLTDFQTTRESAAWLAASGRPPRSHGCATAPTALDLPLQHTPNLALQPGKREASFEDLVGDVTRGLAITDLSEDDGGFILMDQQHASGLASAARVYEIRNGKRVALVVGAGLLFRAADLWKNLAALGGPASVRWLPLGTSRKGVPAQVTSYSVAAVPALVRQLTVIDVMRKA